MTIEVSVLMTVYNGMPYLRAAVESVQSQTLQNFEFIIVDDGSTDGTAAFLRELAESDSRVKVITQENRGTAAAANHGLSSVNTPFVARMDADDVAMPERLEKQLSFMKANSDVGIAGAQIAPIGDSGVGKSLVLPTCHDEIFETMMQGRHGLAHSSIIIRTSILKELGGYWAKPLIDDWDMMLRVGEVSKLANLEDVLLHYRVHSGSLNGTSMWRMHRHIGYAIDCAERRQAGDTPVSFEEYEAVMAMKPLTSRIMERMHVYSMTHYRLAVAEIHGGKPVSGYSRLAWSALCNPSRTIHRISRLFREKTQKKSASNPSKDDARIISQNS